MAMIVGVLVAGVAIILAVHAFKPIVVDRYLFAVPVLVSALLAVPAARLVQHRVCSACWRWWRWRSRPPRSSARASGRSGAKTPGRSRRSSRNARRPRSMRRAAGRWDRPPRPGPRAARTRSSPGRTGCSPTATDYAVRFIGQQETAQATPGACPVLLWFEHTPNDAEDDLPAAVEAAGLTGLQDARLSVARSPTGFVLRADRPKATRSRGYRRSGYTLSTIATSSSPRRLLAMRRGCLVLGRVVAGDRALRLGNSMTTKR